MDFREDNSSKEINTVPSPTPIKLEKRSRKARYIASVASRNVYYKVIILNDRNLKTHSNHNLIVNPSH
ncbi:hypothetical protein L3Y34_002773 [Caenorhabditis briggsae]|uniref:Uncharacterized protein n=1 Tax=Caenorhabditis briggsae TaxID=6238 RepID=A0AAE9DGV3_CAEBR|nr:hypothetical protein L3Y34_002773 [Caenorhabditis briggsae]